jgi:DNA-binding NtrC family response regulator/ferredoxin
MKKIGKYLLKNKICDESSLKGALEQQSELKGKGVFKPVGSILTESMGVAVKDLNQALHQMHYDIISKSTFFKELSTDSIKQIVSLAEHVVFPEDTLIFKEGGQPDSYFIIISGKVKVFLNSSGEDQKVFDQLGPGDGFGEISILTGAPHRNSTKTLTPTSLLVLSKKHFDQLCIHYPEVSMAFIKAFAIRLIQKDSEIIQASEKERAYQQFVSEQNELSLPELIGEARTIKHLRKEIDKAAQNNSPVLVCGEAGTESLVVAGTIHNAGLHASAPFLSMDSENIALENYGAIIEADSGMLQLEMAQSSVLFGYEEGAFSFSKTRGLGLLQICRQGTVVIRNIDKLTKRVQEKLCNYLLDGTFMTVGGQKSFASNARIIATTSENLRKLVSEERFDYRLLELLIPNSLTVPPIKKRKSDLRLLVDFIIIMECFKTPDRKLIKGISPEAYQRIMEYDWPGNMDELQIVIRRAINLAQGEYLLPEDIFIGMAPPEGKYTINLLQFEKIRSLFSSKAFPAGLQIATATVFSLIFLLAFTGSQLSDRNISLLLVWGMWEPLLFLSWFVGARIWCSVCPMGAMNDLLNRIGKKKFKVPAFIHDYGIYLSALGLGIIIWAEVATDMTYSPVATGFLLLSIMSFAILSGIFFERRLWCRYLCPLGTLGAIYSGCSIVEWRSNSSICNSTCKDNNCYKGDKATRGCPLYQGPFSLHSNQNCILCGRCFKLCPNDSPALNLRIPGHELWASLKPEKVTTIFVPVILGTQIFRGIEHISLIQELGAGLRHMWSIYAILLIAATAVSFSYTRISGVIAFGKLKDNSISKGDLFIHAIIPLAFAYEIVYQLNPLLTRFGHFFPTLGRQLGLNWEFLDFAYQASSIKPWQVLFILLGIMTSMVFLKVLVKNHQDERRKSPRKRFRNLPIILLGSIYIWMFVVM